MTGAVLALLLAATAAEPSVDQIVSVARARSQQMEVHTLTRTEASALAEAVLTAYHRWDIRPATILAIIETESSYNPRDVSSAHCRGLTQVNPGTAPEVALHIGMRHYNLFDVADSVLLGAAYLHDMHRMFGRWDYAYSAYNRGPGLFLRQGRPVGWYAKTVARRARVLEQLLLLPATESATFYCNAVPDALSIDPCRNISSSAVPPPSMSGRWTSTPPTTSPGTGCRPSGGDGAVATPS